MDWMCNEMGGWNDMLGGWNDMLLQQLYIMHFVVGRSSGRFQGGPIPSFWRKICVFLMKIACPVWFGEDPV